LIRPRHAAWLLGLGLVVLSGPACFRPSYDHPACGPDHECPAGLLCGAELRCVASLAPDAGDDVPMDAPIDGASLDGSVAPVCLGTFVKVCVDPPQLSLTLSTQMINTDTSALCAAYTATPAVDACVVTGSSIAVSGNPVSVIGHRPLILFSTGTLTISGVLDAASHAASIGPAADVGPCATDFTNPSTGLQGGGGWAAASGAPAGTAGTPWARVGWAAWRPGPSRRRSCAAAARVRTAPTAARGSVGPVVTVVAPA
jgi:hypothetical protein